MRRFLVLASGLALTCVALMGGWFYFFANHKLPLPVTPFEFTVKPGANLKTLSRQLAEAGLLPEAQSWWALGRLLQKAGNIQAGTYRLEQAVTPLQLLQKLNDGDVIPITITFVEGITFAEMRAQLEQAEYVKVTLKGLSDAEVLKRVGALEPHPEGLFFPDTYHFVAGTSDVELLRKSYQTMQRKLAEAWGMRGQDLPYKSPYQVLIMASLIEKESGIADERPLIASVFINRLRRPMRLQTDPTVIYGMGAAFDGNIRKRDLAADTPYNTYTRDGLPPTPIAMPGWGALQAAVQPVLSDKLYFVARGQGRHYFSTTLDEHNRAVAQYQLKR